MNASIVPKNLYGSLSVKDVVQDLHSFNLRRQMLCGGAQLFRGMELFAPIVDVSLNPIRARSLQITSEQKALVRIYDTTLETAELLVALAIMIGTQEN